MNQEHGGRTASFYLPWLGRSGASFVAALIAGGIGIPLGHSLIYGQTDPFTHGWPIGLQISALLSALAITMLLHCPIPSALGLYGGLVGFMLASGAAEYPVASAIGLAVHGLLPAVIGSAIAWSVVCLLKQPAIAVK